jgi:monofunctional biosynthetic peptidoglycan transglycosylase
VRIVRQLLLGIAAASLIFVGWLFAVWPPPLWYATHFPSETAFMRMRERLPIASLEPPYQPVPLDSISPLFLAAVIRGEDNRFRSHAGLDFVELRKALGYPRDDFSWTSGRDWSALLEALPGAWTRRSRLRGASTISQQLAKNLYLSPSRNPLRKVKEAVTAYRLESALGKDRVLELYANIVELGPGVWGVRNASEVYFDRAPSRLTRNQAAALAATLPFPLSSNPHYQPGRMRARQALILRRMRGEWVEVPRETEELPKAPDISEPAAQPGTPVMVPVEPIPVESMPLPTP